MRKAVVLLMVLFILPCLVIWAGGQDENTATANAPAATGMNLSEPGILPIVKEPVKLTIGMPQHVYVTDYDDNYMTKLAEKETGIDLEFIFFPQKILKFNKWIKLLIAVIGFFVALAIIGMSLPSQQLQFEDYNLNEEFVASYNEMNFSMVIYIH